MSDDCECGNKPYDIEVDKANLIRLRGIYKDLEWLLGWGAFQTEANEEYLGIIRRIVSDLYLGIEVDIEEYERTILDAMK